MPYVIVADDEPVMRNLVERIMARKGWTVGAASNGEVALELAQRQPPDLVISDVDMPQMDGLSLLAALRRQPQTAAVPVIIMSAFSRLCQALKAGANAFLSKPFDLQDLDAALREALPGDL